MLQILEVLGGMTAVHLGMMELHGDGKPHLEPTFAIAAPGQEGVIEYWLTMLSSWVAVMAEVPIIIASSSNELSQVSMAACVNRS